MSRGVNEKWAFNFERNNGNSEDDLYFNADR